MLKINPLRVSVPTWITPLNQIKMKNPNPCLLKIPLIFKMKLFTKKRGARRWRFALLMENPFRSTFIFPMVASLSSIASIDLLRFYHFCLFLDRSNSLNGINIATHDA